MRAAAFQALVLNEWRWRARRVSSLVCIGVIVALACLLVADPASGRAMMVMGRQRMAYDSQALAFGTATLASLLMSLASFFLARGRSQEELRAGTSALLAATPVSNGVLLAARFCGALLSLWALVGAFMAACWVLHLLRGEGPLQPWVYLWTYLVALGPCLMFGAAMAVLCDAWAPLMGKRGDLLYFLLWVAQFSLLPLTMDQGQPRLSAWHVLDVTGLASQIAAIASALQTQHFSLGGSGFDSSLPLLHMPDGLWSLPLLGVRLGAAVLAVLPLLMAQSLFHRFSPDRVRLRPVGSGLASWAWVQGRLRGLSRLPAGLLAVAARLPVAPGQVLAEAALTLMMQPVGVFLLAAAWLVGASVATSALPAVLGVSVLVWGVLISDGAAREHQARTAGLTGSASGGPQARFSRHLGGSLLLGLLFCAPVLLRWAFAAPLRALALLAGLLAISSVASLLGRLTGSGRSFLSLFLFGAYVSTQVPQLPAFDALGFNGSATLSTLLAYALVGVAAAAAGQAWGRRTG